MEPATDFAQLQLTFVDQIQWRYEVIRPLVLFSDRTATKRANTSFTYLGSYADSRMACQLIEWQQLRGFENMKPSAEDA